MKKINEQEETEVIDEDLENQRIKEDPDIQQSK